LIINVNVKYENIRKIMPWMRNYENGKGYIEDIDIVNLIIYSKHEG